MLLPDSVLDIPTYLVLPEHLLIQTAAVVADAVNEALEDMGDSEIAKVVRGSSDALVLRIRKYLIRLLLEHLGKVIDGGASTDEVLRIVEEVGKNLEKI